MSELLDLTRMALSEGHLGMNSQCKQLPGATVFTSGGDKTRILEVGIKGDEEFSGGGGEGGFEGFDGDALAGERAEFRQVPEERSA